MHAIQMHAIACIFHTRKDSLRLRRASEGLLSSAPPGSQVGPDNRFHRGKFGRGPVRRFIDWLDWMLPEVMLDELVNWRL